MKLLFLALFFTCTSAFASVNLLKSVVHAPSAGPVTRTDYRQYRNDPRTVGNHVIAMQVSASIEAPAVPARGGQATIAASTFNLAKCIIGAGVLSLPNGVAFFSDEPIALLPTAVITTIMGLLSAYSFSIIGKICEETKADSFQDAWAKSIDPKSAWVISSGITATCFLASLAYSIIIGDSFTSLAKTFNLPASIAKREPVILAATLAVLLPLCSMKSLSALAPFSILGLAGTLYTAVFMAIRFLDKSYMPGGSFFSALSLAGRPSFSKRGGLTANFSVFVLLSMLSTSFIAHFNAPTFYNELKDTSMPRFNRVVNTAFIASILMFIFITGAGFLTFGGATAGFVLNNYASNDALATFARLAIGIAILTGYPFTFAALRDGILDLGNVVGERRSGLFQTLTIGLLGLVTALALVLKDVGFVVSVSGALFGSALMFVVPTVMNIAIIKKKYSDKYFIPKAEKTEIFLNYGLMGTGVVMGALGVVISVLRQIGKL